MKNMEVLTKNVTNVIFHKLYYLFSILDKEIEEDQDTNYEIEPNYDISYDDGGHQDDVDLDDDIPIGKNILI